MNPKGEGFVQLRLEDKTLCQFTPDEARAFGQQVLECAEAADTDAFMFSFGTKQIGLEPPAAMMMIVEFRKWRESHGGTKAPTLKDFGGAEYDKQRDELKRNKQVP